MYAQSSHRYSEIRPHGPRTGALPAACAALARVPGVVMVRPVRGPANTPHMDMQLSWGLGSVEC
jgi:hypothetical protein